MTYTHLTQEERYQIHALKRQGIHLSQIAAELGRSSSTIRRNASQFDAAQWQFVELDLRLRLSPQQVSDRLALEKRLSSQKNRQPPPHGIMRLIFFLFESIRVITNGHMTDLVRL